MASFPEPSAVSSAAYDEFPYNSLPFPQTNPLLLQGIGKLFGLSAPKPDRARVLEIGCASGANILSIACNYPGSQCIGIDYSQKQIEAGQEDIKALGVSNLELKHMSVMDITREFGLFDYIICHGVMSWVAADVQDKIIDVCKTNLAPDGIAYISYNTLPGWNSVRSIRDMMLYHTASFSDPVVKVQQARSLLQFINDSTKDSKSTLASAVEREMQVLTGASDDYLLHEHLGENNTAFYLHEFIAKVRARGLQYVGDTDVALMYSGNLPDEATKVLATSADMVRTEQYMDFVRDRRFRRTLLCHNGHILNWDFTPDRLREGWVVSHFGYPDGFAEYDILSDEKLEFQAAFNWTFTPRDPVMVAMLQVFFECKSDPVSVEKLVGLVREKLEKVNWKPKDDTENPLEEALMSCLIRGIFLGGINFYLDKLPYITMVSNRPMASKLARYQAKRQEWVSNQCQEYKSLILFDRMLIEYLDGMRDIAALAECMLPHFASKTLSMLQNNIPVEGVPAIKAALPEAITERLMGLCEMALLVA